MSPHRAHAITTITAAIAFLVVAFTPGCGFFSTPVGQALARTALDIVHDEVRDRLLGGESDEPVPEFCAGEERVCYVHDLDGAGEFIERDFEQRGESPDTEAMQCFDAAEETGNDSVTGYLCYVPELE